MGATPLILAVQLEDLEMKHWIMDSLLEAGADISIKTKYGDTVMSYIPDSDTKTRALIRKHMAQASVSNDDIASDDDGESGSGSDEE